MKNKMVYINGQFIPESSARLHVSDLAIQRGYGIFDFFKTSAGRPVFLDDHLARFYRSAELMRLSIDLTREQLKNILEEFIRRNGIVDAGIRITLTGGDSTDGYSIGKPNLIINTRALPAFKPLADRTFRLMTHPHQRQLPEAKTLDYLMAIFLQPTLREKGVDDVVYHSKGLLLECPRSNIFLVDAQNRLRTPASNILRGVIRAKLLAIARDFMEVVEGDVSLEELQSAREVFITSTTKNVAPVSQVDGRLLANGTPGNITHELDQRLSKLIRASLGG